ncbi:MAG: hypothetical protein ACLTE2_11370 [Eubacteriales bacterium]
MDPWFSYKLDGILKERSWKLSGILNGIDTKSYDPESSSDIYAPYNAAHPEGKTVNKQKLQERLRLEQKSGYSIDWYGYPHGIRQRVGLGH